MLAHYSYGDTLAASERIDWRIDDIIGGDKRLDATKALLPETLARTAGLHFLTANERRTFNQIRGHAYLSIFGVVEEFILPFVLDHARPQLRGDDWRVRALLNFAAEEAKHIQLFKAFRQEFASTFRFDCQVIGPPETIAKAVLAHHPLAVALIILQTEWMTQHHYVDSIKDNDELDAQFKSLLRHHWMEEAQHAKLDTLMVEALSAICGPAEIASAIDDYWKIVALLDNGLEQQTRFDIEAFTRATGRRLSAPERDTIQTQQRQATRWTFLGSGMMHPNFLATVEDVAPAALKKIKEVAKTFS